MNLKFWATLQGCKINKRRVLFVLALVLLVFAMWSWSYLHNSNTLPIKKVKVLGSYPHVNQFKIKQTVAPLVSKSLFSVNLGKVREKLLTLPWVKDAVVTRVWPDQIDIQLSEKTPLARWGKNGLISKAGQIFYPSSTSLPKGLPVFYASKKDLQAIVGAYQTFSRILTPLDLHISELRLTSTKSWSMRLDNGTTVELGQEDLIARLQRFERVYGKIFGDRTANYVDLRYPHGLAVKWQQ